MSKEQFEMLEIVKVPWADDKDDFLLTLTEGEWGITTNNELVYCDNNPDIESGSVKVKKTFLLYGLATFHTTDFLRFFCNEHHPEVDFDGEFETHKAGVFARYQEKFGHDYEEWVNEEKYKRIKESLKKLGYLLPYKD